MRRYICVVTAILALCCCRSAYAQANADQGKTTSRPVLQVQDVNALMTVDRSTKAEQREVTVADPTQVEYKLPYSVKTEWVVDLQKLCPECVIPEHAPGNAVSVTLQPPSYALVGDGARAADECVVYKALIASLREAKAKDEMLITAYRRQIAQLQAKVKALEVE